MTLYHIKLYSLLTAAKELSNIPTILQDLKCFQTPEGAKILQSLQGKYETEASIQKLGENIASSSDRVNLHEYRNTEQSIQAKHPISGQSQSVNPLDGIIPEINRIKNETDAEKAFWWFWRFYPELLAEKQKDALLFPAHRVIPDCPLHSYQSTVSALTGAMYANGYETSERETPYLLIFSFSPVQDFIKASRKFLDFWAGSYLLHYLGARLCWLVAEKLGPDAVIVPSLWSQEIIDAFILDKYPDFKVDFTKLHSGKTHVERFNEKISTSLSTAGFPNMITVLAPGKDAAKQLGKDLTDKLREEWLNIGEAVRKDIHEKVTQYLKDLSSTEEEALLTELASESNESERESHKKDIEKLKKDCCWAWNNLWNAQLRHTWEPYWTAVPLGVPDTNLSIDKKDNAFDQEWIDNLDNIAQSLNKIPSLAEISAYDTLNVGTWWGSLQQRLRVSLQSVKYTRNWQIPAAPGERSTISGQFSAVHPLFHYIKHPEGKGLPAGSMRLFWLIMSKAYPGLFNGSERLNALEITKRMAWIYGRVAKNLGIEVDAIFKEITISKVDNADNKIVKITEKNQLIYERLLRFPNLSSIAAARFIHDNQELTKRYRDNLNGAIKEQLSKKQHSIFRFISHVRSSQVPKTDFAINPTRQRCRNFNGTMFSRKWLAEDMRLNKDELAILRNLVYKAHRDTGFGDSSPTDWWVIVLADGDGMGGYVSGEKLKKYEHYIVDKVINHESKDELSELKETPKRMGPATHVGLNRALLDFSNRLVPYITEHRFCGRVIYSGGDDVMAVLPLEDLPEYLISLRAAWCGALDPKNEFTASTGDSHDSTGYWYPVQGEAKQKLPDRPHFTMGTGATMSMGVVIAHKSVPLPTVLESIWKAEAEAKKTPGKDGICFRVIYGGGNQLEAKMKGTLLDTWWDWVQHYPIYQDNLAPLLYRLSEELPQRACLTPEHQLFSKGAKVIMTSREASKKPEIEGIDIFKDIEKWIEEWETWALKAQLENEEAKGIEPEDLGNLLRFTAFWVDKRVERLKWEHKNEELKTKTKTNE
jgi:CRISPR-associated protein Cmr2